MHLVTNLLFTREATRSYQPKQMKKRETNHFCSTILLSFVKVFALGALWYLAFFLVVFLVVFLFLFLFLSFLSFLSFLFSFLFLLAFLSFLFFFLFLVFFLFFL